MIYVIYITTPIVCLLLGKNEEAKRKISHKVMRTVLREKREGKFPLLSVYNVTVTIVFYFFSLIIFLV